MSKWWCLLHLTIFFSTCNVEIDGVDDLKTDVTQLYTQRVGDYAIFHNVNLITRHLLSRNKPSHLIKRCLRHLPDVKWHKPIKEDEEQNKFVNQKKNLHCFPQVCSTENKFSLPKNWWRKHKTDKALENHRLFNWINQRERFSLELKCHCFNN